MNDYVEHLNYEIYIARRSMILQLSGLLKGGLKWWKL